MKNIEKVVFCGLHNQSEIGVITNIICDNTELDFEIKVKNKDYNSFFKITVEGNGLETFAGQIQYIAKQINMECEVDNIDGIQMCIYYDDQTVDVDIIDGQSDLKF